MVKGIKTIAIMMVFLVITIPFCYGIPLPYDFGGDRMREREIPRFTPATCSDCADLLIDRLSFSPGEPRIYQPVTAEARVLNNGTRNSTVVNLTIYWDCYPQTIRVDPIVPGNYTYVKLEYALVFTEAGKYDIRAMIDSGHEQLEQDESNNVYTQQITVSLGDPLKLPAGDLYSEPKTPIKCADNFQMGIGREKWNADYYRDIHGVLLRGLGDKPWGAVPRKNQIPWANFDFAIAGDTVSFTDKSTDNGNIVAWYWNFSDGHHSTLQNVSRVFPETREYMVSLTVTDNQGSNATVIKSVHFETMPSLPPKAEFSVDQHTALETIFYDNSHDPDGAIINRTWNLGDPPFRLNETDTLDQNPGHQYYRPGIYKIRVTAQDNNGTNSTTIRDVQIESIWLPAQKTNQCGTTSIAYTLRAYTGDNYTPAIVDEDIRNDWAFDGMFTDPISIVDYARDNEPMLFTGVYHNGNIAEIKHYLDRGAAVLLDVDNTPYDRSDSAGHWIVAVSHCIDPDTGKNVIGIYNPWGYQYQINEDRLQEYWDEFYLSNIYFWNRLYVVVSPVPIPPDNIDDIKTELSIAQSVAMVLTGVDEFVDGEIISGIIDMAGGAATAIAGIVSHYVLGWLGERMPMYGGFLTAADELVGGALLIGNDIISGFSDAIEDLIDWDMLYNPLVWLEFIGEILWTAVQALWDALVLVWDFIVDLVMAIVQFFADLFEAIGKFLCWLFGLDCTRTICIMKRAVSIDPCGETNSFMNKWERKGVIGYIYDKGNSTRQEIYLNMMENFTDKYYNITTAPMSGDFKNIKLLGYSSIFPFGESVDLTSNLKDKGNLVSNESTLGYIPLYYSEGNTKLWLFQHVGTTNYTIDTNPCAGTHTFVSSIIDGYTRKNIAGYIGLVEKPGTMKLYRYWNHDTGDFFLSLDDNETVDGYSNMGYTGYVHTENIPGTVGLKNYNPKKFGTGNMTINCEEVTTIAETIVGYINEEKQDMCTVPLYEYCKREIKEE